jgi:hypothetical protein
MIPFFMPAEDHASSSAMVVESDSVDDAVFEQCVYPSSPPFRVGQSVSCCDGSNSNADRYDGVVRKVERLSSSETNEWSFFVQPRGLNAKWARWVSKKDLLPKDFTCESSRMAANGAKKRKQEIENDKSSSSAMTISSPVSRRRRKYNSGRNSSTSSTVVRSPAEVCDEYCELPVTLRNILAEESAYITKKEFQNASDCGAKPRPLRRLHSLPATVTVKQLLQHFEKRRIDSHNDDVDDGGDEITRVQQFCHELALLFDKILPTGLLYPEEIPQYKSACFCTARDTSNATTRPCEVYGCNFLLRLLVRLPHLQHHSEPSVDNHHHLLQQSPLLADLIVLLQKNRQVCFRRSYREPTYEELLDWEKALVVDEPEFGYTTATTGSIAAATVEPDEDNDDMAITPTTKKTRTKFPY